VEKILFNLDVIDDWPPVNVEGLYCKKIKANYEVCNVPFFIKDLSVGDIISIQKDENECVDTWHHINKSKHSTTWVMIHNDYPITDHLDQLRDLGCMVEQLEQFSYASIDIPADVDISLVDDILDSLDEDNVSLAFPSFRHD
jgi:hypothetical protein